MLTVPFIEWRDAALLKFSHKQHAERGPSTNLLE